MTRGLAGILLTGLLLAGCGGGSDGGPAAGQPAGTSAKAEPHTEDAVRAVAEEQADRYSSGDFAGAWDMWTKKGKDAVPKDVYVEVSETCDLGGIPLDVTKVRLDSKDEAVVRIGLGDTTFAYQISYEDGAWRWQPEADTLETYALGTDAAVAKMRNEGSC